MMSRILLVEDDIAISKMTCMNLRLSGHTVVSVFDGADALRLLDSGELYDIALVDIMLPKVNGFVLLEPMKAKGIPIIFLTAKDDIESKLKGLTNGAEDYIVKPFDVLELLARIDNVLKRHEKIECIHIGDVELDITRRSCKKGNESLYLTFMEFDLLVLLAQNKNVALSRDYILSKVWGINYEGGTRTVDVHIAQLRRKTGLQIVSIPKYGYRLEG